jgi:DNA-binding PadR family transcriptional regulator
VTVAHRDDRPARPLTPATFHILLSLAHQDAHGYHIKRMVEERTGGAVQLGAGTLYAGIQRMVKDGVIEETDAPADAADVEPGSRWRFYAITTRGRKVLDAEIRRLESDLAAARALVRERG